MRHSVRCALALVVALGLALAARADDYDAGLLNAELAAQGLAGALHGCNSRGEIHWRDGHPTPAEASAAAAVKRAHDPTRVTEAKRLQACGGLAGALAIQRSAAWGQATTEEQKAVQECLDRCGAEALERWRKP